MLDAGCWMAVDAEAEMPWKAETCMQAQDLGLQVSIFEAFHCRR